MIYINLKVKTLPSIRMSFAVSEKMKSELDVIAAKRHITVSELIRDYIDKGMNVDKTASDIDFIRKQIREELDLMLKPQVNRLAKLLMRIGMMTAAEQGLEGIVAKRKDSKYYFNKTTKDWIKMKALLDADFIVCGYYIITGNTASAILGAYKKRQNPVPGVCLFRCITSGFCYYGKITKDR